MVVYVLKNGEKPKQIMNSSSSSNASNSEVININTATKEQLMKISGIGKTKAEAIIEYREKTPFKTIDEIKNIKGIGDKKFDSLKEDLSVDGATDVTGLKSKKSNVQKNKKSNKTEETKSNE